MNEKRVGNFLALIFHVLFHGRLFLPFKIVFRGIPRHPPHPKPLSQPNQPNLNAQTQPHTSSGSCMFVLHGASDLIAR